MKKRLRTPSVHTQSPSPASRTIRPGPTSITAFIGRTRRGPVDRPVAVSSLAEYIRIFGPAWPESTLDDAVRLYFENGGTDALIIRVENGGTPARIRLPGSAGDLLLQAASPGTWGNEIEARVETGADGLFALTIREIGPDGSTAQEEVHPDLSVETGHPRDVRQVLTRASMLVRCRSAGRQPPDPTGAAFAQAAGGSDGLPITDSELAGDELEGTRKGLWALDRAERFNLLCIPPPAKDRDVSAAVWRKAAAYCEAHRAFLIIDPPSHPPAPNWRSPADPLSGTGGIESLQLRSENAAIFFPRITAAHPEGGNSVTFAPCGAVAGVVARTDRERGVWKAPAGLEAGLRGATGLEISLNDAHSGSLNAQGINSLRTFPGSGPVIWGARTLKGADHLGSEWKYIPVRRLALHIEDSIENGLLWTVFEPNDEPLWATVRAVVANFLLDLFRQGALQGRKPEEAFFVRCDRSTTTQADIEAGFYNLLVGFAPLKPAEFVILRFRLEAGRVPDDVIHERFTDRPSRFDPYRNFRFRIRWENRLCAGFKKVSGLPGRTAAASPALRQRAGTSHNKPEVSGFEAITLERGVTHDAEFEQWASGFLTRTPRSGPADLIIELYAENGSLANAFALTGCRVTAFQALPELDAGSNAIAIETMTIEYQGLKPGQPSG